MNFNCINFQTDKIIFRSNQTRKDPQHDTKNSISKIQTLPFNYPSIPIVHTWYTGRQIKPRHRVS